MEKNFLVATALSGIEEVQLEGVLTSGDQAFS
jgi:hypothetical protein